jgi:hypothetical protein
MGRASVGARQDERGHGPGVAERCREQSECPQLRVAGRSGSAWQNWQMRNGLRESGEAMAESRHFDVLIIDKRSVYLNDFNPAGPSMCVADWSGIADMRLSFNSFQLNPYILKLNSTLAYRKPWSSGSRELQKRPTLWSNTVHR